MIFNFKHTIVGNYVKLVDDNRILIQCSPFFFNGTLIFVKELPSYSCGHTVFFFHLKHLEKIYVL